MLKRILAVVALVTLTGCATHQQSNQGLGAVIGGAIGHNTIGGAGGTAVGAMIGAAIGGNQPTQHSQHYPGHSPQLYPNYSDCAAFWNWQERQACQRGVDARLREEQNRRNAEAYRRGYGR